MWDRGGSPLEGEKRSSCRGSRKALPLAGCNKMRGRGVGAAEREPDSEKSRTPEFGKGERVGKRTQSLGVVWQEDPRKTEKLGETNPGGAKEVESGPTCTGLEESTKDLWRKLAGK